MLALLGGIGIERFASTQTESLSTPTQKLSQVSPQHTQVVTDGRYVYANLTESLSAQPDLNARLSSLKNTISCFVVPVMRGSASTR